ncbi:MAG: AAA family ATPase, partial [Candidatus Cryptobacteroides sp.]
MEQIRQIPYGVSDFRSVIEQSLYYVDKSMYIEELERQSRTLIFIRPRRFGKSLFLNMMRLYYDKNAAGDFERLFGDLYIGHHPTPLRNHYQVLYMDFSRVTGIIDELPKKFNSYCCGRLDDFIDTYRNDYPEEGVKKVLESTDFVEKINLVNNMAMKYRIPLYLFIDEYDNFTNVVLNEHGEEIYHQMTHASGFYREVFKLFKGMFERIFLTGVSPVTLDDLTSGFNIGWNASMQP